MVKSKDTPAPEAVEAPTILARCGGWGLTEAGTWVVLEDDAPAAGEPQA